MTEQLSETQAQVSAFMAEFLWENDQLPPTATIAAHFGWNSSNAAYEHVRALERKGVIERNAVGKYRFRGCAMHDVDQELHRHRCEVRQVIRWRSDPEKGEEWVRDWLKDSKVRGRRRALVTDIKDQLDKGNTGVQGEWR